MLETAQYKQAAEMVTSSFRPIMGKMQRVLWVLYMRKTME